MGRVNFALLILIAFENMIKYKILLSFILILFLSSCAMINRSPKKLYKRALKKAPYDVAIVPGVPYNGGDWDRIMRGRVLWAIHLYNKGIVKNIIFSGGAVYSPYAEGDIMVLYAEQIGVPREHIFAETEAEHSVENVYYSAKMAYSLGFKSIVLTTDPFQTALLKRFLKRKYDPNIAKMPFIIDVLSTIDTAQYKIDPSSAYRENFVSIVERQSKFQRFRDTAGRKTRKLMRADRKAARKD